MGLNRKQFKVKRHSCALCKPNSVVWEPRFREKERLLAKIQRAGVHAHRADL